jgi:MYXO-CTERM domain-containing protein
VTGGRGGSGGIIPNTGGVGGIIPNTGGAGGVLPLTGGSGGGIPNLGGNAGSIPGGSGGYRKNDAGPVVSDSGQAETGNTAHMGKSGCSCEFSGRSAPSLTTPLLVVGLALLVQRRRRKGR